MVGEYNKPTQWNKIHYKKEAHNIRWGEKIKFLKKMIEIESDHRPYRSRQLYQKVNGMG